ncbi:uncharacterized protein LOC130808967 isoform X2 [Amaranthus tricolor]|nr:uncharacterized protein LOC130808967 isoform X2 [Amaranthus tricolor]
MVEIFQIRIDKFDDTARRGELYGDVQVVDIDYTHTLYHRDRATSEHIRANSNISLQGPNRAIDLMINFAVNIDLRLCGEVEDVVSKWQLSWTALKPEIAHITRGPFLKDFCHQPNMLTSQTKDKHEFAGYEQPLSATFEEDNGCCVTMFYAILEHAVIASIQVRVIDKNVVPLSSKYQVRGTIFASYSHFEVGDDSVIKEECKTTIFKTSDFKSVKAEHGKKLELSRWVVAVPAYSSLIIEADLWDTDSSIKIAEGKLECLASNMNLLADYILGYNNLAIEVMVCWVYGGSEIPEAYRN